MGIGTLGFRLLARMDPRLLEDLRSRVAEFTFDDPQLPAKFFPYKPHSRSYILPRSTPSDEAPEGQLPIPPRNLWLGYAKTPEQYLASGHRRADQMREILATVGFKLQPGAKILDFGCASGIVLRWLPDIAKTGEAWGVDISSEAMIWCQQNLSPPFKFATTTSFPHLPFEDHYFDFVYALSVFTHIAELAEAWLLELKRVVRPGGRLFITVHDNETIKCVLDEHLEPRLYDVLRAFDEQTSFRLNGFSVFSINRTPGPGTAGQAQVFYDLDYLLRHWGGYLKVITTVPRVFNGKQTAIVFSR